MTGRSSSLFGFVFPVIHAVIVGVNVWFGTGNLNLAVAAFAFTMAVLQGLGFIYSAVWNAARIWGPWGPADEARRSGK